MGEPRKPDLVDLLGAAEAPEWTTAEDLGRISIQAHQQQMADNAFNRKTEARIARMYRLDEPLEQRRDRIRRASCGAPVLHYPRPE